MHKNKPTDHVRKSMCRSCEVHVPSEAQRAHALWGLDDNRTAGEGGELGSP